MHFGRFPREVTYLGGGQLHPGRQFVGRDPGLQRVVAISCRGMLAVAGGEKRLRRLVGGGRDPVRSTEIPQWLLGRQRHALVPCR